MMTRGTLILPIVIIAACGGGDSTVMDGGGPSVDTAGVPVDAQPDAEAPGSPDDTGSPEMELDSGPSPESDGAASPDGVTSTKPDASKPAGSWPDKNSTGIAGVGLTAAQLSPSPKTGTWKITTPNAVFDKFHHKGSIQIDADNVTLRRCLIEPAGGWKVVQVNANNATIEDCTIRGKSTVAKTCVACISGRDYTARRVNVSGCADGFKLGGTITIEDSYSHGLFKHGNAATGTHNDSLQLNNGGKAKTVTLKGNAFHHHPCNSNRHLQVGGATIGKLVIEGNFFHGSHGVLNIGGTIGGGQVKNNVLAGSRKSGPFTGGGGKGIGPGLYTGTGVKALVFSGNTFESGESVDTDTRIPGKYKCVK